MSIHDDGDIPFFCVVGISSNNGTSILTSVKRSLALTFLLCYCLLDISSLMTHRHLKLLNMPTPDHLQKVCPSPRLWSAPQSLWAHSTIFFQAFLDQNIGIALDSPLVYAHVITTFRDSAPAVFLPPFLSFTMNPSTSCLTFTKAIASSYPTSSISSRLHIGLDAVPLLIANLLALSSPSSASISISVITKYFQFPSSDFLIPHFLLPPEHLYSEVSLGPSNCACSKLNLLSYPSNLLLSLVNDITSYPGATMETSKSLFLLITTQIL